MILREIILCKNFLQEKSKKDLGTQRRERMRKNGEKIGRLWGGKRGHEVLGTKLVTSMKNVLLQGLGCPFPS